MKVDRERQCESAKGNKKKEFEKRNSSSSVHIRIDYRENAENTRDLR